MVPRPAPNKQNVPLNNISKDKEDGGSRARGGCREGVCVWEREGGGRLKLDERGFV